MNADEPQNPYKAPVKPDTDADSRPSMMTTLAISIVTGSSMLFALFATCTGVVILTARFSGGFGIILGLGVGIAAAGGEAGTVRAAIEYIFEVR